MRCFIVFLGFALSSPVFGQSAETLIVRNVSVVPMDEERVLPNRMVVIRDGRIAAVAEDGTIEIAAGAREIDGSGKFLMPGLAEMHAHVPGGGEEEAYRHDVLFLYLANGVTLIRGMLGDPIHLELRQKLEKGTLDGPRLVTSGPSFNSGSAPNPERAKKLVEEQKKAGYDFIKVASGTRAAFDAMVEAAGEAEMPFSGHVPAEVGIVHALESGYASIDHLDGYMQQLVPPERAAVKDPGFFGYLLTPHVEPERIHAMARQTRAAGVWNVPTESLMRNVLTVELEGIHEARPEFRYMPKEIVDGWIRSVKLRRTDTKFDAEAAKAFMQVRLDLIRALHEAGAGLLLGSDAPQFLSVPGFSLHGELAILAETGLSPFEILRTGTVAPAIFFGEEKDHGKVERGMRADLILLEANPLEDVRNARKIAGVFRDGRWFSKEEIDKRLKEIAARYAR